MFDEKPTGKIRFRPTWNGKALVQIEVEGCECQYLGGFVDCYKSVRWRDAKIEELNSVTVL